MIPPMQTIVFDFDGVLTDDRVWVDQDGREMVCCSRRDGLGFDILRQSGLKLFILSTETNPVVSKRAAKLKVTAIQGCADKARALTELAAKEGVDLSRTLYVGNDLNDLPAIRLCGYSACPADAHPAIKDAVTFVLATSGGHGVVRDIVEDLLQIKMYPQHSATPDASS
jgi:3-deoxy-D-manno-octulosonate 8-phosphate phosphatase (KDO 8-P phosphatase)